MKTPAPIRTERNRGADLQLIEMLRERPNQKHIRQIAPNHYWVDLPADVFLSVHIGPGMYTENTPNYEVNTWRNAYERARGDQ